MVALPAEDGEVVLAAAYGFRDDELAGWRRFSLAQRTPLGEALATGARGLAEVTTRASDPAAPLDARFRIAGRVAELVATTATLASERERPWLATADDLVVEEWDVTPNDAEEAG
jgi:hypothetical protein